MKSVFIILGNGCTIDFINKYNDFLENKKEKRVRIDVQNLFRYGEVIGTPWDDKPGFLFLALICFLILSMIQIKKRRDWA